MTLAGLKNTYPTRLALMEMHIWSGYPLYNAEAFSRAANFYGNTSGGVPYIYMDGTSISTSNPGPLINQEMNKPSPMTDSMWGYYNPGPRKGRIYVSFRNDSTVSITGNIYFVVIEDSIDYHAPNGDTLHNDVIRDYLPDQNGSSFTIPVGQTATKNDSFMISASWNINRCYILAWIQQTGGSRRVFQASMKKIASLPIAIEENNEEVNPEVFHVQPNPCAEGTRFSFVMPAAGTFILRIYDPTGRLVWEQTGTAGTQRQDEFWSRCNKSGDRVGAGVYPYLFECGGYRRNGTIVVR